MNILDPAAVLRISLLCSQKQCPVIFWPNPMIFQTWRAWQEDHTFSSCPKTQLTFNENVNCIATSCKKTVFENHLPRKLDKPLLPDSHAFLKEFPKYPKLCNKNTFLSTKPVAELDLLSWRRIVQFAQQSTSCSVLFYFFRKEGNAHPVFLFSFLLLQETTAQLPNLREKNIWKQSWLPLTKMLRTLK